MQDSLSDDSNYYSIFVDAAYNEAVSGYAVAYTIFDPGRKLWAAGFKRVNPPCSILAAELLALLAGISAWNNNRRDTARAYTDSLDAVQAVSTDALYLGVEEDIIKKIKNLL